MNASPKKPRQRRGPETASMPPSNRMGPTIGERRRQLLACAEAVAPLATNRAITAVHVSAIEADHEIRRVLETIVRRWTKGVEPSYASRAGATASRGDRDDDHVVPCRVLVDRMIMNPDECLTLLETSIVLARISKAEHATLGGIYRDHQRIYEQMLLAPAEELPELGLGRYAAAQVRIRPLGSRTPGTLGGG